MERTDTPPPALPDDLACDLCKLGLIGSFLVPHEPVHLYPHPLSRVGQETEDTTDAMAGTQHCVCEEMGGGGRGWVGRWEGVGEGGWVDGIMGDDG